MSVLVSVSLFLSRSLSLSVPLWLCLPAPKPFESRGLSSAKLPSLDSKRGLAAWQGGPGMQILDYFLPCRKIVTAWRMTSRKKQNSSWLLCHHDIVWMFYRLTARGCSWTCSYSIHAIWRLSWKPWGRQEHEGSDPMTSLFLSLSTQVFYPRFKFCFCCRENKKDSVVGTPCQRSFSIPGRRPELTGRCLLWQSVDPALSLSFSLSLIALMSQMHAHRHVNTFCMVSTSIQHERVKVDPRGCHFPQDERNKMKQVTMGPPPSTVCPQLPELTLQATATGLRRHRRQP